MAKRNVDVVVGARTDAASFQKAEQRTRGFFARLRGASGGGGGGDKSALEQSQRLLGQVAAITATIVAVKEVANILNSASNMFAARSAEARGDIEAAAKSWAASVELLRSGTITGPFVQMAEAFESLVGIETLSEVQKKHAEINANQAKAEAAQEAAARRRLALLEKASDINLAEFRRAEKAQVEQTGDVGDIETFNIRRDADERLKRISILETEARAMKESGQKQEVLANLERARGRVVANMAADIDRADKARIESIDKQIDAVREVAETEARLFGKEGVDREIELIKMRTEAREKEIKKLIEAAETDKQRIELARLLADIQQQAVKEIAAIPAEEPEPAVVRPFERAGLASAQEGLSMSGIAAAAQANQAIERQKYQVAEDTKKNTKETVEILAQLLDIWRSGGSVMPILN